MLRLLAMAALSLAAAFGGPEDVDPNAAPVEVGYGEIAQLGVDGNARAYWLAERAAKALVLERCGGGWQPAFQDGDNAMIQDLAVAPSGAAAAVWFEDSERGDKVSASFRPAATGAWETPAPLAGEGAPRVAIHDGGAIVVANDDWTVRKKVLAFPRPWSGGPETVATYVGTAGADPRVEYLASGVPVVVYGENSDRFIKAGVRGSGGWDVGTVEDATPNAAFSVALARHTSGLVAVWRRSNGAGLAVSRYHGTWDTPHTFPGAWPGLSKLAGAGMRFPPATSTGKPVTIADVVRLPSAKKCRNSIRLTFRRPAKRVALTVNGRKVKVRIGRPLTIKLRKRTTLKITVTLADGKTLKTTARLRPC